MSEIGREVILSAMGVPAVGSSNSGQPLPGLVIVPARPGADGPEMEPRYSPNGLRVMLPVFSSVAGLVARLGQQQPWICVPLSQVREVAAANGLARVVIDPEEIGE